MGTGQALNTRIDVRNGVTSLALSGELDMATVPILKDLLADMEQDGSEAIVLDLRDLQFIDSSGVHAFIDAHSRSQLNGHDFMIVGVSTAARRLFEITGTEFLLDAQATVLLGRFTGDGSPTSDGNAEASTEAHV